MDNMHTHTHARTCARAHAHTHTNTKKHTRTQTRTHTQSPSTFQSNVVHVNTISTVHQYIFALSRDSNLALEFLNTLLSGMLPSFKQYHTRGSAVVLNISMAMILS